MSNENEVAHGQKLQVRASDLDGSTNAMMPDATNSILVQRIKSADGTPAENCVRYEPILVKMQC